MYKTFSIISQFTIVLLVIVLVGAIIFALNFVLEKRNVEKKVKQNLLTYILFSIVCWLLILSIFASFDFFINFKSSFPNILFVAIPPILFVLYLSFSKRFYHIIKIIPAEWFIYIQSFRVFLELSLWLGFLEGFIPFQVTIEGFNFDIIIGLTAIMGGFVFFGRGRFRKFEAIIWNISGILLLLNMIMIISLSVPSSFRVFMNEPDSTIIAYFPFIWIPGFIIPFAFAMHFFSLKQLVKVKGLKSRGFNIRRREIDN